MPPKKETAKKPPSVVARPNISDSSLLCVPNDAVEGFIDRINTGVEWTLTEQAARHHKEVCQSKDIPKLLFSEALQNKLEQSILNTILNTDSKLSLEDYWELILPTTLWDHEKFDNDAAKICFRKINCITDNLVNLIKTTCKLGERRYLMRSLKKSTVLRLNDTKMTDLDEGLLAYKHLLSLNLCGNYIEEFDDNYLPDSLKTLELHANRVRTLKGIAEFLPRGLIYLGLSRNLLDNGCSQSLSSLPYQLTVLDMSDNGIYDLEPVLTALEKLPNLVSLALSGNPCSVCAGYARMTLMQLPRLHWLDYREVLPSDRPLETLEIHPDDLRASYFYFTVFRVMSAPQPPKADKGAIALFHVELELPLLDSQRRQFLMFRRNESLVEMLPPPEDDSLQSIFQRSSLSQPMSILGTFDEQSSHASDIYKNPVPKNSREVLHYRVYESSRVPWAKIMNFQEPAVKIFCPDLVALRDTFRSVVTIRLVYTLLTPTKVPKDVHKDTHKDTHKEHKEKKPTSTQKVIAEQRVVLAEVRCALKQPDWSHPAQHFHWDNSMESNNAIHWGDGDLSATLYSQLYTVRTVRAGGYEVKNPVPEDLTMQVGFHIESLRH